MFNQEGFNRVPFNREFTVDVYGRFDLFATGEMFALANMYVHPRFELEGAGELLMDAIRQRFGVFDLEAIGELQTDANRDRPGQYDLIGLGELSFSAGRYHIDEIEFNGEFNPGDRLVIDSKHMTMTINGQNALHMMQGDFFDLILGTNEIIYQDTASGRTVLMRITHRDKYV